MMEMVRKIANILIRKLHILLYFYCLVEAARDSLLDLPPRAENELDPITLHNMALTDPQGPVRGLPKLAFLLELGPPACPSETFANILLICCQNEMYDTAADILAEHTEFTYRYLSQVPFFIIMFKYIEFNLILTIMLVKIVFI